MKRGLAFCLAAVLPIGILGGCGSKDGAANGVKEAESQSPVTVRFGIRPTWMTETEAQRYIVEPVKKKYPYITVEMVWYDDKANSIGNLIASGTLPDINVENSLLIQNTKNNGLQFDMTDILTKNKFDPGRFGKEVLETIKFNNQTDYLVGIPYYIQFNALYYNKDIFDRFGVPYPKDGMTWYEVTELAKQVTRNDGGTQYRGFEPDSPYRAGSQLSLPLIDPKTYKSVVDTDGWKKVLTMIKDVYSIPGNGTVQQFSTGLSAFVKNRNVAMLAGLNNLAPLSDVKDIWSNWDLAQYPTFPEKPGIGTQADMHLMLLSPASPNKDAAYKVMSTVVSDEVQLDMSRHGRGSVLKDKKFQDEFGKDLEVLKGKNVQAIFKTQPAPAFPPTEFASKAFTEISELMKTMVKSNLDVNTAVRQYTEKMDKYMEDNRKR